MIALLIKKIGYCFPVSCCFFFKDLFKKMETMIAITKLQTTIEKPSLNIGCGENKPLLVNKNYQTKQ